MRSGRDKNPQKIAGGEILSEEKFNSTLGLVIIFVSVVFIVTQVPIWTGAISIDQLGNLNNGLDKLLDNPAFVGLLVSIFVGVASGFMQNVLKKNETFSIIKFGETFYYYEPLMILIAQFIPVKYGVVLLFAIDVVKRVVLKLVPQK
jgi:hypothetical protein